MLFHWFTLRRMMAVSGRISALIDRLRHDSNEPAVDLSGDELLAAIRAATAEQFADEQLASEDEPDAPESVAPLEERDLDPSLSLPTRSHTEHLLFLGGLVLGGLAAVLFGTGHLSAWQGEFALRGENFHQLTDGSTALSTSLLLLGGTLVGFGTRMAGGCTSGHGLCGTSRLQPGSLLATLAFFGAGVVTSFVLGIFL